MPPKRANKKLHELCAEVKVGTEVVDTKKRTFVIGKQFATGGFGRIHTCRESGSKTDLVVKLEPSANGPLFTEVNVFQRLLKPDQIEDYKKRNKISWLGVPRLISSGIFTYEDNGMRYLIIPKYAESLESIREAGKGVISSAATFQVAINILDALAYLHEMNYTHADVKAANILLEKSGDFGSAVLVDYGLARLSTSNEDKPDKKRAHNGTAIFTSSDAHRGCHPSYRGDVEILAYNIIYWLTGTLPWAALESTPDKVYDSKKNFLGGLPATLTAALKDKSDFAGPVRALFDAVSKTNYTAKVDFKKLHQALTLAKSKAGSSKEDVPTKKKGRQPKAVVEEAEEPSEPAAKKASRGKKAAKVEEKENEVTAKAVDEVQVPSVPVVKKKAKGKAAANVEENVGGENEKAVEENVQSPAPVVKKTARGRAAAKVEEKVDEEKEIETPASTSSTRSAKEPVQKKTKKTVVVERDEPVEEVKTAKRGRKPVVAQVEDVVQPVEEKKPSSSRAKKQPMMTKKTDKSNKKDDVDVAEPSQVADGEQNGIEAPKKNTRTIRKRKSEESVEEATPKPEVAKKSTRRVIPVPGLENMTKNKPKVTAAKKIEKKYKRLSMGRSVIPVAAFSPPKAIPMNDGDEENEESTTTVKPEKPVRTGISPGTKTSPSKLRKVPGMRNFPRGRRSGFFTAMVSRSSARKPKIQAADE